MDDFTQPPDLNGGNVGAGFFGVTYHGVPNLFQHNTLSIFNVRDATDIGRLKQVFSLFDRDGSGYLDLKELRSLLTTFYNGKLPPPEEETLLMKHLDLNGSGTVTLDEFIQGCLDAAGDESAIVIAPVEYKSGNQLRHDRVKHTRRNQPPQQQFRKPMTSSQSIGWEHSKGLEGYNNTHHNKCSDLTHYLDACEKHEYGRSIASEFSKFGLQKLHATAGFGMGM